MHLTFSRDKIEALMGTSAPVGSDESIIAEHVIDGILDNNEVNDRGFGDWTAELAIETYVTESFLASEEIDTDEIEWDDVNEAVGAAIAMLQLPTGIVLVNADSHAVFACGDDLEDVQEDLARELGIDVAFTPVGYTGFRTAAAGGRYIVAHAPMPKGGWEADNADFVLAVGDVEGYLLTHEMAEVV